jgi:hypothetical protein
MTVSRGKYTSTSGCNWTTPFAELSRYLCWNLWMKIWLLSIKKIHNREEQKVVLHQRTYSRVKDCVKLSQDKSTILHNLVAKTLFATKRARPDTCTAIAFLTTRVRASTTDDWRKLSHLMKYLRGTRNMLLV